MRDIYDRVIAEVERPLIQMTLSATRGNQIKAAAMLGLNRNTLRKKIRDLEISGRSRHRLTPGWTSTVDIPASDRDPAADCPGMRSRMGRSDGHILLGKLVTLVLAAVALVLAIATFVLLSGGAPITLRPNVVFVSILASAAVLLLLGAVLAGRLTRVWVERRRGLGRVAFARTPRPDVRRRRRHAVHRGGGVCGRVLQPGHPVLVRRPDTDCAGLRASTSARSSLEEHRNNIKADALGVAITLNRAGAFLANRPSNCSRQVLDQETTFHGLIQAVIYDPYHA